MSQQHDAAKLGIWLFLATEVLLFGGLFCGDAVFRANHPDLFVWGEQFLDERYGAANTAVLLISSLTMAMAITYVQQEKRRLAMICLGITFVCAGVFMAIKSVEYEHKFHDHLLGGMAFYQTSDHGDGDHGGEHAAVAMHGDADKGKPSWDTACRSCHGPKGGGIPGQGSVLNKSEYVQARTDSELVEFIKVGRLANAPNNTMQLQMPPKGGNPMLKEAGMYDIVAYLRTLQVGDALSASSDSQEQENMATTVVAASDSESTDQETFIESLPRSTVQHANQANSSLAPSSASVSQRMGTQLPEAGAAA